MYVYKSLLRNNCDRQFAVDATI